MIPLDLDNDIFDTGVPILYVMSDARGDTGIAVVRAAAAQFDGLEIEVIRVPNVKNVDRSLLFSAHREAPPMDTPPSSLEDTFGKYAVPTSNFPFTSCRICFNEAVEPSVIADFPAEKSASPASPPFPTIGA